MLLKKNTETLTTEMKGRKNWPKSHRNYYRHFPPIVFLVDPPSFKQLYRRHRRHVGKTNISISRHCVELAWATFTTNLNAVYTLRVSVAEGGGGGGRKSFFIFLVLSSVHNLRNFLKKSS